MNSKQYNYYLNAFHYIIWLADIKAYNTIDRIVKLMLCPIIKLLFSNKLNNNFDETIEEGQVTWNDFRKNPSYGLHVSVAHYIFGFLYSGYPAFLSFSFVGLLFKITGTVNPLMIMIVYSIPLCIFFIFAYKAVFSNDCYLVYFKKFEKEDAAWHKKWERRTIAFCIGSILSTLLGIFSAIAITLYL